MTRQVAAQARATVFAAAAALAALVLACFAAVALR